MLEKEFQQLKTPADIHEACKAGNITEEESTYIKMFLNRTDSLVVSPSRNDLESITRAYHEGMISRTLMASCDTFSHAERRKVKALLYPDRDPEFPELLCKKG